MFDPDGDLSAIWSKLAGDSTLLGLLGWTTGKNKADFVWKGNRPPSEGSQKKVCFYFAPSRASVNDLCSIEVVQFDAYAPNTKPQDVYAIQKRIRELVHMQDINGRQMWFAGQQGDMPAPSGYVCLSVRYRYPIVV